MLTQAQAHAFALDWIDAWNAHDLPRVLAHYSEDFSMRSPYIVEIAGVASGELQGKPAVAEYWRKALAIMTEPHFDLLDVLLSVDSVVISYRNHAGRRCAEVFRFNAQGLVFQAAAHYSIDANDPLKSA